MIKTICLFGIYNPNYSRNRVLTLGLEKNGVKVIKCKDRSAGVRKYINLIKKHHKIRKSYDILVVAFPGWPVVWLAKLLTKKPIIYDAFLSVYEGHVQDRKKHSPKSIKARYCWFLDWISCKLADKILLDTNEHIKYFIKEFGIKKDKFIRVLVGTGDSNFYPQEEGKKRKEFIVHFHGSYIPLQGVEYILRAANLLERENIKFNIIGSKIKKQYQNKEFSNAVFVDDVPYKELPNYMARADICLGIFGNTPKTQRVIPNKVYEAIAMKKPVITANTPAARELFTDRENILFCKTADPKDLARKILELKNDLSLRNKIAKNSYKLFNKKLTPKILGKKIKDIL